MTIASVQEYIFLIEQLKSNYTYERSFGSSMTSWKQVYEPHFIFRGHSNDKYLMLPFVLREGYSQMEYNMFDDFMGEACRFIRDIPVTDIPAWLEIAQHFGVPTRLLDFSENPLVALYFACSSSPKNNASVWIINAPAYNKKFFNDFCSKSEDEQVTYSKDMIGYRVKDIFGRNRHSENQVDIRFPWIYKPYYHEERMNLQSSIFMIWGTEQQPLTDFLKDDKYIMVEDQPSNSEHGIICQVNVPAEHKNGLLKQLDLLGINEKYVYPGVDGVGRYIKKKYLSNK